MSACEFVTLTGGLIVARPALELVLDLEARGVRLAADGDALLVPKNVLTAEERLTLRRWKRHVLALLAYHTPEVVH